MKDAFSGYHPLVNTGYFVLVLTVSMICIHPVTQGICLICACWYAIQLKGKAGVMLALKVGLPVMVMAALLNPLFNHAGVTMLWYLPNGNPMTLESILYGWAAGCMLATVLLWFVCVNEVLTSDKLLYLFGRVIPSLALLVSMTLRLIPRFRVQLADITEVQRTLGRDPRTGTIFKRLRNAITILSILITWALEDAVETADSMRSRGYGLPGRTSFHLYRIEERDRAVLLWMGSCGLYLLCGAIQGGFTFRYFPNIYMIAWNWYTVSLQVVLLALAATPLILNWKENRIWHSLHSEM